VADPAALLKDTLAQLLRVVEGRLVAGRLLRAYSERKNAQQNC
jgi:hypothetical protein